MVQYYRCGVDDVIFVFKDLAQNPTAYASLFDHWFLGYWRDLNRKYSVKVQLNIYYQTEGFTLQQMPDKWKKEWQANSHWLRLGFHALQNDPPRPYLLATYEQIAHDYDLITPQIVRFAGSECVSSTITVHYCEAPKAALMALKDRRIKVLIGLFQPDGSCSYHFTRDQIQRINEQAIWKVQEMEITFVRCTAVINNLSLIRMPSYLKQRTVTPATADHVELLIHEQYYRKELHHFQRTIRKKMETAIRYFDTRGYKSTFWDDLGLD